MSPTDPFPAADLMKIGVYYYPEAWPPAERLRDFANIRRLGFEFVHLGEFAWTLLEPEEGHYNFAWLDESIERAHVHGLKVILCTPSAAPPIWLTERHPEVLMIDAQGVRQQHGTRQHACWSQDVYRVHVGRIVTELARRYGADDRIWGWQIDNELCHYGKEPCFCNACQSKFRAWLKVRYADIEHLNRDWGTTFWSQRYQRFEQVRLPNEREFPAQFNPHAMLDAQRWFAHEAADYLRFQASWLRRHAGSQWITSNHIHNYASIDPSLNAGDFDIVTWTIYPVHGTPNRGSLGFRLGDPSALTFAADYLRTRNGRHALMELQPGQVNWGEVNPQPLPGAVRLWILQAFAARAKFVCTYRYRQPRSGAELYHHGIVGTDGVTPTQGGSEFVQAIGDLALLRAQAKPDAPPPPALLARRAALLFSRDSRWDIDNHKQHRGWDTYDHLLKYHRALKRVGAPVDVITEDAGFEGYPVLVAPACQLLDAPLVTRWKSYVEAGGHLVLSCRSGQKDRRGHLWDGPWAAPLLDLIGTTIDFYDTLPAPNLGVVLAGAERHGWFTWADVLAPAAELQITVLATYGDQYYAGRPAAVTRSQGKGTVTYIGVDSTGGTLEAQLIREVYRRARIDTLTLAEGFLVDWRDGLWIATNASDRPQPAPIPAGARVILGALNVPVAGVTVWQE